MKRFGFKFTGLTNAINFIGADIDGLEWTETSEYLKFLLSRVLS